MSRVDGVGEHGRTLIRNVLSAGGSQAALLLVSLLVTPVLVYGLGLERYGLWALAGVFVNYLGLLDLGVGTSFVRFLTLHRARQDTTRFNQVVRLGLVFYGAQAVVLLPVVFVARQGLAGMLAVPPELRGETAFLLVGVTSILLLRSTFLVYRAVIAALERLDVNNGIALALVIPNGVGAVLVVQLGWGLRGLVLNGLLTALATVALQVRAAYRLSPALRLRPFRLDLRLAPDLLRYGLRIQAARVAELINGHVDKLILGVVIGATSVGLYDLGMKLSLVIATLPTLLLPTVMPTTSLLEAEGNHDKLAALHRRATKYVGLVWAPAAGFVLLAAPLLLRLWIGDAPLELASATTRLLVIGTAPLLVLGVSRLTARGIGAPQLEMRASLVLALANVLLSLLLVRALGAVGAPLGSALAGLIGGAVFLTAFSRQIAPRFGFQPLRPLASPFAAAGAAMLAGMGARWLAVLAPLPPGRAGAAVELGLVGVPFVAVYVLSLSVSRVLDDYDQRVVRATWDVARSGWSRPGAGR